MVPQGHRGGGGSPRSLDLRGRQAQNSWAGKQSELHDGPILLPEPDRIGLVATGSLVLHSARLRVTSGKALLLAPAKGGETEQAKSVAAPP